MNINGHEVEEVDGWLHIDGASSGWLADNSTAAFDAHAERIRRSLATMELLAEYTRRVLEAQEQAAKDADLDRRARIYWAARDAAVRSTSIPIPYEDIPHATRKGILAGIRALDADAAERGTDA